MFTMFRGIRDEKIFLNTLEKEKGVLSFWFYLGIPQSWIPPSLAQLAKAGGRASRRDGSGGPAVSRRGRRDTQLAPAPPLAPAHYLVTRAQSQNIYILYLFL